MSLAVRIFHTLPGRWTFTRMVPDRAAMTGEAHFTTDGTHGLHYREEARVTLPDGRAIPAFREYTYTLTGEEIAVHYQDPANGWVLFASFRFDAADKSDAIAESRAIHLCGADTYRFHYRFNATDTFTTHCNVAGPRKGFDIHTVFTRDD